MIGREVGVRELLARHGARRIARQPLLDGPSLIRSAVNTGSTITSVVIGQPAAPSAPTTAAAATAPSGARRARHR